MENEKLELFENQTIRTAWNEENEEWYFSIVDVIGVLTEQSTYDGARDYWKVLKIRLKEEGNQLVTNCNQLKMKSPKDGKRYATDVANVEQLLRIIQSVPSKKAEPFKLWLAQVGRERIEENKAVAKRGGNIAGGARRALEEETGVPVITSQNAVQLNQLVTNLIEDVSQKQK